MGPLGAVDRALTFVEKRVWRTEINSNRASAVTSALDAAIPVYISAARLAYTNYHARSVLHVSVGVSKSAVCAGIPALPAPTLRYSVPLIAPGTWGCSPAFGIVPPASICAALPPG
jgi:hypothetical protein